MRWMRLGWTLGALVAGLVIAGPAVAQDLGLVTTLVHPNMRESKEDRFGSGVAISGGTLFVGAKDEGGANDYSGAVHVFSDQDWSEVALLKSSNDRDIEFGAEVQLDGDRALISNRAIDNGVVWFFERVGGVWTEKLRVQGVVNEAFGYSLALRGDFAFIAASRVGTGSVHVYRRMAETWSEVQVLTASDAQDGDFFGYAISFDGQRLAVSAPGNLLGPKRCGVYTFSRQGDGFVEDGKLAGDPATQWFGADVGVSGEMLIVNAPPAYQVTGVGKALVYQRRGEEWELDSELTMEDDPSFPGALTLDGDKLWFGTRQSEPKGLNVYAFERGSEGWQRGQMLTFPTPGMYELASWAVQDDTLVVGFWNGLRTESVQVYRGAGHQSSSGGGGASGSGGAVSSGSGGAGIVAPGGTNSGGTTGENTAAMAGTNSSVSGGNGSIEPSSSGGASSRGGETTTAQPANSESSDDGGCSVVTGRNSRAWPVAALALAVALVGRRRNRRAQLR
ncbi:MAG TPA: FG-GAP repeat protein [Polyangiaceae bacterium]|nr:FG-GAP repeat protein [Polyangiaceae bacterium]